jgi:hypothetical protein
MRTITVQERRWAMVHPHHHRGDADDPEGVTRALIALHASDPASVYSSVLARSAASTLADVADAMYEPRCTGWNRTTARRAVHDLAVEEVDLHGQVAIDRAASHLHARLDGSAVTPAIRTPLHQVLTRDDGVSRSCPKRPAWTWSPAARTS